MASASTPPTPSITVIPNCGSRLRPAISSRVPRTIGATSRPTSPSSGRAAASSSAPAASTASADASPRRTRPRSVLWAMASPHSLTTTGNPISAAAAAACAADGDDPLVGHGHAVAGQQRLGRGLGERRRGRHGGQGTCQACAAGPEHSSSVQHGPWPRAACPTARRHHLGLAEDDRAAPRRHPTLAHHVLLDDGAAVLQLHVDGDEGAPLVVARADGGHHDRVDQGGDGATVHDAGRLRQLGPPRQAHAAVVGADLLHRPGRSASGSRSRPTGRSRPTARPARAAAVRRRRRGSRAGTVLEPHGRRSLEVTLSAPGAANRHRRRRAAASTRHEGGAEERQEVVEAGVEHLGDSGSASSRPPRNGASLK